MNSFLRRRWLPTVVFALLAVIIMGPLLAPGYILHYDMVFSPYVHMGWEELQSGQGLYSRLPIQAVLLAFSYVLPMDLVQKLILIGILFLAGYVMYRAVPFKDEPARLFAGFIYVVNPFVYDRFMAGHWLFLLAYAITPLALLAFQRLFTKPALPTLGLAVAAWSGIAIINPHHIVILGILYGFLALVLVRSRRSLIFTLACPLLVALASLWWILPAGASSNLTSSFTTSQLYSFATRPDPHYGLLLGMLGLQGFWHQGWLEINRLVWWPLAWFAALVPVWFGLAAIRRHNQTTRLALGLFFTGLAALWIAAGPSAVTYPVNVWIFEHVPGASGLREPQKLLALLALGYAFMAAIGIERAGRLGRKVKGTVMALGIIGSIITSWPLLWGLHGQLQTIHYPGSWYRFQEYVADAPSGEKILVLPWQPYIEGGFSRKLVANPASSFYGSRVIQNNALNLPGVTSNSQDQYPQITRLLSNSNNSAEWVRTLRQHNIRYVMIMRTKDRADYSFLTSSGQLRTIIQDRELTVLAIDKNGIKHNN